MNFLQKLLALFRSAPYRPSVSKPAAKSGYPPTFGPIPGVDAERESYIFDPSLAHYLNGFRRGDPALPGEDMARWHRARRRIIHHLLDVVVSGPAAAHLVLRGSLALKATVGAEAREPGDIDWVVQPPELRLDEVEAKQLIEQIIQTVKRSPASGDVKVDIDSIVCTDIWTYERAPGQRIAFPWACADLPPAVVQMDFVFEETLHEKPVPLTVKCAEMPDVTAMAASDPESLGWKLLWLSSDSHPQGKDLYDAVLLAERCKLPASLLKSVLGKNLYSQQMSEEFPFYFGGPDWENFLKECPWVKGTSDEWIQRLKKAIFPAVNELMREKGEAQ